MTTNPHMAEHKHGRFVHRYNPELIARVLREKLRRFNETAEVVL